jgi:DNA repair exonuclease SbcCD ATPase subunit
MEFSGAASEADIGQLIQVLQMLEDKKARLTDKRNELQESIRNAKDMIAHQEDRKRALQENFEKLHGQCQALPPQEDLQRGKGLQGRLVELRTAIASAKQRVTQKQEEKQRLLREIYAPADDRTRHTSLRFIHHGLLSELSDLVRQEAAPELLIQKEKQIRLCEAIQNM